MERGITAWIEIPLIVTFICEQQYFGRRGRVQKSLTPNLEVTVDWLRVGVS
jgi:hypothetical protein